MDTFVRYEVKKNILSYQRLKTQKHLVSIGLSGSGFSCCERFIRQFTYPVFYIQNRKTFSSKKSCFFALLGTASPLKTF